MSLEIQRSKGWASLRLSCPPRNLLSGEMLSALIAAIDELAGSGAPPLLLCSSGRHFSTGYPIDEIPEEIFHADPDLRANSRFERVMAALSGYPAPIVAALEGDAYGGAVELLCCADLRIATPGVRIGLPAARLGLIYSLSGIRRLNATFGSSLAREMLLTGEPVSARRALSSGWLCRLAAKDRLMECAEELLKSITACAPLALQGTRRALEALGQAETLPDALLADLAAERHRSWLSEDFKEAQRAFIERRKPRFTGR